MEATNKETELRQALKDVISEFNELREHFDRLKKLYEPPYETYLSWSIPKASQLLRSPPDRRIADLLKVAGLAQAVLTALNVGNVMKDSPLHLKLREVMIEYRAKRDAAENESK